MRKLSLLTIFLIAGCGQGGQWSENAGTNGNVTGAAGRPVQTSTLTGLYEETGIGPSQLCITEEGGTARFGLVKRSGGVPMCSGSGIATRSGSTVHLVMSGEGSCTINAQLEGGRLALPSLPAGCSYYCSPGGGAGAITLDKTGGTRDDALRAHDAVGGRLCA